MSDAKTLANLIGTQRKMAAALDISPQHVNRMIKGEKGVPRYVPLIANLLPEVPPNRWPDDISSAIGNVVDD